MQAQKIILGELGKEFGGAAAAAGDPITKLKVIVGNASESIGGAFLPVVDKVATTLGVFVPAAVGKVLTGFSALGAAFKTGEEPGAGFVGVMQRIGITSRFVFEWFKASALPILKEFGGLITGTILPKLGEFAGFVKNQFVTNVIPAVKNLVAVFKPLVVEVGTALVGAYRKLAPPIISLGTAIASNVGPVLKSFTGFLRENGTIVRAVAVGVGAIVGALLLYKAALGVVSIATKAYAAVQAALNVVMSLNPIGVVILALVGLSAGLVYAYKHSEKFREIVDGAFRAVAKVVTTVVGAVVGFFRDNWKRLPLLLLGPIGIVLFIFKGLPGKIVTALGNLGRLLLQAGKDLVTGLKNGITSIARTIGRWTYDHIISPTVAPFMKAGTWLHQAGKNVIAGFWNGLKEIWTKVTAWISGIATWIKDHKGPVSLDGRLLVPAGRAIMSGFLKGLKSGAGPAWDFVQSVGGKSIAALRATLGAVGGLLSGAGANIGQNAALGKIMATAYGWTGAQWDALYTLWQHESGWNNNAQNPTSTAYGIAQFLNSTWGSVGASKTSDPAGQIAAGLRYIAMAYGSPANAWSKWQSRSPHWYAKGTPWVPNDQLAFVHRGEAIVPADVNRAGRDARAAAGPMTVRLSDEDRRLLRDAGARPIHLDSRRIDEALSSRALRGGY